LEERWQKELLTDGSAISRQFSSKKDFFIFEGFPSLAAVGKPCDYRFFAS
jgi:hypothetical protein